MTRQSNFQAPAVDAVNAAARAKARADRPAPVVAGAVDAVTADARARAKAAKETALAASAGTVNAVSREAILAARAERAADRTEEFEANRARVVAELRNAALGTDVPATPAPAPAEADPVKD
jgi:hypothetical protein